MSLKPIAARFYTLICHSSSTEIQRMRHKVTEAQKPEANCKNGGVSYFNHILVISVACMPVVYVTHDKFKRCFQFGSKHS